jgi:pimeloyl-ACP methyl ester carboxylesterase
MVFGPMRLGSAGARGFYRRRSRLLLAAAALGAASATASCASRPAAPASTTPLTATAGAGQRDLNYEVFGAGRPVVLLHGYGLSTYSWRYLVDRLVQRQHYQVYAVDLKGFGKSPKPIDGAYSVHDQARLIARLIAAERLCDVTLIGHSLGGGVALVTTLDAMQTDPGRIASLVLIDPASYRSPLPFFVRVVRAPIVGDLLLLLTPPPIKAWALLYQSYYDAGKISPEAISTYAATLRGRGARHALRETLRQLPPADAEQLEAQYPTIAVPTLIVWGRHDRIIPLDVGRRLHAAIAGSELIILEASAHISHEEAPGPTADAVVAFLAARDGGPRRTPCP